MWRTMFRLESVCGGLAFTVTLLLLPCVQTVCIPAAILLRMNASQGMKSDCHHLAEKVVTVATCKSATCSLGGNAFNYVTDRCFIKRCSDGNLKLVSDTNSDVYSLFPLCTDAPYAKVSAVSDGVASNCPHLKTSSAKFVEQCGKQMCQDGGNTFNFQPTQLRDNCNTKRCERGRPIPWYAGFGGNDVYTTLPCYNDNGGCDHNCSDNGTVTSCSCRAGFKLQPDMKSCQDIDECKDSTCDQTCVNFPGGYNCSCQSGYSIVENKSECFDIDECGLNQHSCQQLCENTRGSYICSCQSGYKLEGKTQCMNVDECTAGLHNCAQTCTNTDGSYSCSCREGYISPLGGPEEGRNCTHYCTRQFTMTVSKSGRVSSSCPTLKVLQGVTLEHSLHVACNISSNVINALDDVHVLKRCPTGELELTAEHGGWDVYTRISGRGQPVVQNAFPTWAIGIIVVALVVVVAVIVIVILFKRRASRTTEQRSEQPQQDKDQSATQGTAMTPDGGATRRLPEPVQMSLNPGEGVYEEIAEDRGLSSVKANPDHAYYNVHPPKKASNYDRLNKNEIAAPVITEYESMNI